MFFNDGIIFQEFKRTYLSKADSSSLGTLPKKNRKMFKNHWSF